jgi:hypothetical protein
VSDKEPGIKRHYGRANGPRNSAAVPSADHSQIVTRSRSHSAWASSMTCSSRCGTATAKTRRCLTSATGRGAAQRRKSADNTRDFGELVGRRDHSYLANNYPFAPAKLSKRPVSVRGPSAGARPGNAKRLAWRAHGVHNLYGWGHHQTSYERRLPTTAAKTTMAIPAARPSRKTVLCCKTPISLKRASAINTIIRRPRTPQRRGDPQRRGNRPRSLLRTRAIMVRLPIYPSRNFVRAHPLAARSRGELIKPPRLTGR